MSTEVESYDDKDIVDDESDSDSLVAPVKYSITSFGVDFDIEGVVRRIIKGDIKVPDFQRNYVWSRAEASRLVESFLLGLPVPGVFLASESDTKKLLVIDGQQRLRSLEYFYKGEFNPSEGKDSVKKFRLTNVQPQFEGKAYVDLSEEERRTLDNSVIHATVVKQESPDNDDTGMYHIFERLNTGGKKLVSQEIRSAIYHGTFIELLKRINNIEEWRIIFGPISPRLKDQELILRYFAFLENWSNYQAPMADFLSKYSKKYREISDSDATAFEARFDKTIKIIYQALGGKSFKIIKSLNAAVFDSVMVALSEKLQEKNQIDSNQFATAYNALLNDETYKLTVSKSTGNETSVELRFRLARQFFKDL